MFRQDDAAEVRTFFAVGTAYGGSLIVQYGEQILQRRNLLNWKVLKIHKFVVCGFVDLYFL